MRDLGKIRRGSFHPGLMPGCNEVAAPMEGRKRAFSPLSFAPSSFSHGGN